MVEFASDEVGVFEFLALRDRLEAILKLKVDLVAKDALAAWLLSVVEREAIRAA